MNDLDTLAVDRAALVTDLANMIRIPSVNQFNDEIPDQPAEAVMADYFETRLRELDLDVDSRTLANGRRNVWGRLKGAGTGPTILLAGHLDTVGVIGYHEPFEPKIEDGKIFGRGSCDMKAGLATYLEVIRILIQTGTTLAGDLIVAGVVDEEHAMIGSIDFGNTGPTVDYAIVAEPTRLAICPAHKGQICMTIKTHGLAAHSSMPENGVNAIYHMSNILQALQGYADALSQRAPHPMCGNPSFSVGVIRGGDNPCAVPDVCEIEVDRRVIPGETYDDVIAELTEIFEGLRETTPDLNYEFLTPFLNVPPLATPETSPLMKALSDAAFQELGHATPVHVFPGATDAPNFNCPSLIFGAGDLAQCHSLNEYIDIAEIETAVKVYVRTILAMQDQ